MKPQIRRLGTTGHSRSMSLPREMVDLLRWKLGDYVSVTLNEKEKTLTLKKINL